MQVLYLGRAPYTKETLRGLTGSQQTPGFWGVTICIPLILSSPSYSFKKLQTSKVNFIIMIMTKISGETVANNVALAFNFLDFFSL